LPSTEPDQINADHKANGYGLARRKNDQRPADGSEFKIKIGMRWEGGKKCEEWKRSQTRTLFVTDSIQLIRRVPHQRELLNGWETTIGGQVHRTVRYVNDLVLLPQEPGSCNLLK